MLPWARNALRGSKLRSSNADVHDMRGLYAQVDDNSTTLPMTPGWKSFDATRKRQSTRVPSIFQFIIVGAIASLFGAWVGRSTAYGRSYSSIKVLPVTLTSQETLSLLNSTAALPEAVARNLRLSYAECDVGFPLLWSGLEKTREHFYRRGIELRDIEEVEKQDATRVAIVNGQLYVKRFKGEWTKRSQAVLASLHQAVVTSPEPVPDVELFFRGTDNLDPGPHWGLNREDTDTSAEQMWLLPDFGFWSWPEPRVLGWQDARRKAKAMDARLSWSEKSDKLFWRGAFLAKIRENLRDAAAKHPWADIGEINWGAGAAGRISMEDHCKYKFLASVEGNSAYSGRLKYLALCRSVVVSHKMRWAQHFHGALDSDPTSPHQNIVILEGNDFDNLPQTMEGLVRDSKRAQLIADNSARTLRDRYLTPAAVNCYWRRAIAEYATTLRFKPSIGDGVDYESFMLVNEVHWEPH
ncbi:hypothetical protein OIO90_001207 [Microbotryomycetes sp. JL221]|nr:hypothetical protein OIO90_001207 [Microbotryomycetes sp. JL221]